MLRIFMISFSLVTEFLLSLYVLCVCEIFLIPSDILSIEQRNHIKITTRHFLFTSVSRRLGGSSKNEVVMHCAWRNASQPHFWMSLALLYIPTLTDNLPLPALSSL